MSDELGVLLIEAKGIGVSFGGRQVLRNVDVQLYAGEIVTVIGLNGAGKSTLVRILLGLVLPDKGRVVQKQGLRVGYSPQKLVQDPSMPMTVERFLQLGGPCDAESVLNILAEVGVANLLKAQVGAISGGEMRRVLLARALLRDPELLVLDEPMAGVDVTGQSDLYRLIAEIRDARGCGILLVSHDLYVVMAATDRVVCLDGHVCCTGRPEAVSQHPEFVSLFGKQVSDSLAVYVHHHDHRHDLDGNTSACTDGDCSGHHGVEENG